MSDTVGVVSRALRAAPPDQLVEVVDRTIRAELGATRTDVLIADYRLDGLWPVRDADAADLERSGGHELVRRCFRAQQVLTEADASGRCRWYLPLSVWGERVGVLLVELPRPAGPEVVDQVREIAGALATALRAADPRTDRYHRARRRERLSMAAELQWELLPARSVELAAFRLAGQLEPAYTVAGDHFDWAADGDRLTVTVLDGSGVGLAASILTAVAVNALRNARRSGEGLVEQAELASDTVFHQHRGRRHVATLLLELDTASGRLYAVDAGSPHLLRLRGGELAPVPLEQQLPLGMFAETHYDVQEIDLEPGDRLFVVSDGVWAADPAGRAGFGERAMGRAMRATRLQPPPEAVGTVMRELRAWHDGADLRDDAVVVCLDWPGPGSRDVG